MLKTHFYDLKEITTRYGVEDHELLKVISYISPDAHTWIAGGAIRSLLLGQRITTDIDFFFTGAEAFERFSAKLKGMGATRLSGNEHQTTFQLLIDDVVYKIQAITIRYYKNIVECLDSFDFSICQFAIYNDGLHCGEYSLWDLARHRLVLHRLTYGVASVRRLIKYARQGFTACAGCITQILQTVAENPSVINSDIKYLD